MVSMGMGVDLFREDVEGTIGEANLNIGGMCILFLGISHLHQNVAYEGACRGLDVHVGGEMVINSLVGIGIRSDDLTDAFVEEETNERLPYIPNALKCDRSTWKITITSPRAESRESVMVRVVAQESSSCTFQTIFEASMVASCLHPTDDTHCSGDTWVTTTSKAGADAGSESSFRKDLR